MSTVHPISGWCVSCWYGSCCGAIPLGVESGSGVDVRIGCQRSVGCCFVRTALREPIRNDGAASIGSRGVRTTTVARVPIFTDLVDTAVDALATRGAIKDGVETPGM
jgi:hypothetical protein